MLCVYRHYVKWVGVCNFSFDAGKVCVCMRVRVCERVLTRLWSTLKKAIWQGLLSRLAKAIKASAVSKFRISTAAMNDIPCTYTHTGFTNKQKWEIVITLSTVCLKKRYYDRLLQHLSLNVRVPKDSDGKSIPAKGESCITDTSI